jgi:AcrR family transcriptional regulator
LPRVLSDIDVAEFRERLCQAAERLFAERGPDAVTMRQLASELGVSPMTPYRYFRDKEDILAAVRTAGFNRFADVMEAARTSDKEGAWARAHDVGTAYVDFAQANPHTYKLMFDFDQPCEAQYPELSAAAERAQATMTAWVHDVIAEGALDKPPHEIGAMFWAMVHGLVVLEMAGKLPPGAARHLHRGFGVTLEKGLKSAAK